MEEPNTEREEIAAQLKQEGHRSDMGNKDEGTKNSESPSSKVIRKSKKGSQRRSLKEVDKQSHLQDGAKETAEHDLVGGSSSSRMPESNTASRLLTVARRSSKSLSRIENEKDTSLRIGSKRSAFQEPNRKMQEYGTRPQKLVIKEQSKKGEQEPTSTDKNENSNITTEPEVGVFRRKKSEKTEVSKSPVPSKSPTPSKSPDPEIARQSIEELERKMSAKAVERLRSLSEIEKAEKQRQLEEANRMPGKKEGDGMLAELLETKNELLNEIRKWGDPVKVKKMYEEQKVELDKKLQVIQAEVKKLESIREEKGFMGSIVYVVDAIRTQAEAFRASQEVKGKNPRTLIKRMNELESDNERRGRRMARIESQMKEVAYLLKEKAIDNAEYEFRIKHLLDEKLMVETENKKAIEELIKIPEQIATIERNLTKEQKSNEPVIVLEHTKRKLQEQIEHLDLRIEAKLNHTEPESQEETNEKMVTLEKQIGQLDREIERLGADIADMVGVMNLMDQNMTEEEMAKKKEDLNELQRTLAAVWANKSTLMDEKEKLLTQGNTVTPGPQKMEEDLYQLEQIKKGLEVEIEEINKLLVKVQGPRQRAMIWATVAAIVAIYIQEFSKTFLVL